MMYLSILSYCPVLLQIPKNIPRPDYYEDGTPRSELRSKQQSIGKNQIYIPKCTFLDLNKYIGIFNNGYLNSYDE